jgi:hypothetical protein
MSITDSWGWSLNALFTLWPFHLHLGERYWCY